jgi:hypothetical protein
MWVWISTIGVGVAMLGVMVVLTWLLLIVVVG